MLKLLLYCFVLHTVCAHFQLSHGFGKSYMRNSRLCHQWTCINNKLGLPDDLPPKEQYAQVLKGIVPQGPWQDVIKNVVEKCYGDRSRSYTNTCPGQALLHCTVDQMVQFCPESSLRKEDACAPLQSLAGFKYMFSQSRYNDLEKNLPTERRPPWFLKHYFSSKCCNLPEVFEMDQLAQCGFSSFLLIHVHKPTPVAMPAAMTVSNSVSSRHILKHDATTQKINDYQHKVTEISANKTEVTPIYRVNVVDISQPATEETQATTTPKSIDNQKEVKVVETREAQATTTQKSIDNQNEVKVVETSEPIDPSECCDLSGFIQPSWRSECDFQMSWDNANRLSIKNDSVQVSTTVGPTAERSGELFDVVVVPQSCDKTTCVFKNLNILSENGSLDLDGFSKLLDNMTLAHASWTKAKARTVTQCLRKPLNEYVDDCEINKVLTCTFDVLSENCPHAKFQDPCSHAHLLRDDLTCQISSSKTRPKYRRLFCGIPNMVNHEVLLECGVSSLTQMEYVPILGGRSKPSSHWWNKSQYSCKGSTDSTKCLLKKMGVLSKYGFLDYFKMKDRIRSFARAENVWSNLSDVYLNTLTSLPMYRDQCSTTKKLFNVVDSMLVTCPMSKRKPSLQCNRLLTDMASTPPKPRISQDKSQYIRHFGHVSNRLSNYPTNKSQIQDSKFKPPISSFKYNVTSHVTKQPIIHKNPSYDFGILNSKDAPQVQILDITPRRGKGPLVIPPVYVLLRSNGTKITLSRTNLTPNRTDSWTSSPIHSPVPNMAEIVLD